jgi:DNA invertase Pin-like site-specific DNA recombinase
VAFLSRLLEAGVDVLFCDLPTIEGPSGRFMLQQMASVAELEAGLISARTKAALAAAKARGRKLGGVRSTKLTDAARAMGRDIITKRAADRAADYAPVIREIQAAGTTSLQASLLLRLSGAFRPPRGSKGLGRLCRSAGWSPSLGAPSRVLARAKLWLPKYAG